MPKKTGLAVSFVITGALAARWMEDGRLDMWMLAFSAFCFYWLGYGLGSLAQAIGGSPQESAVRQGVDERSSLETQPDSRPIAHQRTPSEHERTSERAVEKEHPTTADDHWIDQLRRLGGLLEDGLLTQAEFDEEKARILPKRESE